MSTNFARFTVTKNSVMSSSKIVSSQQKAMKGRDKVHRSNPKISSQKTDESREDNDVGLRHNESETSSHSFIFYDDNGDIFEFDHEDNEDESDFTEEEEMHSLFGRTLIINTEDDPSFDRSKVGRRHSQNNLLSPLTHDSIAIKSPKERIKHKRAGAKQKGFSYNHNKENVRKQKHRKQRRRKNRKKSVEPSKHLDMNELNSNYQSKRNKTQGIYRHERKSSSSQWMALKAISSKEDSSRGTLSLSKGTSSRGTPTNTAQSKPKSQSTNEEKQVKSTSILSDQSSVNAVQLRMMVASKKKGVQQLKNELEHIRVASFDQTNKKFINEQKHPTETINNDKKNSPNIAKETGEVEDLSENSDRLASNVHYSSSNHLLLHSKKPQEYNKEPVTIRTEVFDKFASQKSGPEDVDVKDKERLDRYSHSYDKYGISEENDSSTLSRQNLVSLLSSSGDQSSNLNGQQLIQSETTSNNSELLSNMTDQTSVSKECIELTLADIAQNFEETKDENNFKPNCAANIVGQTLDNIENEEEVYLKTIESLRQELKEQTFAHIKLQQINDKANKKVLSLKQHLVEKSKTIKLMKNDYNSLKSTLLEELNDAKGEVANLEKVIDDKDKFINRIDRKKYNIIKSHDEDVQEAIKEMKLSKELIQRKDIEKIQVGKELQEYKECKEKDENLQHVLRDTKLQTQSIVESSKNEITNLTQKASYLQEKLNAKDEIIDSLRNQYEIQKQQLDQAIQDANENKEHASREVANVRKSEETIQKLMEALQKIRQRIQIIERNEGIEVSDIHDRSSITLEGVEEKLKLLKQENIDESEKKKSLQNIIEKQNRHIALLRTELKKANTHLTKTESELSGLNHKHAKYDVKLSDLEFTMKQLDELKLVLSLSTDCEIDEVHEKLHEILKLSSETNSKSLELLDAEKVIKDSAANQTELCEKLSNLQGVLLQKDFQIKDYEVIIANQKDRCIQLEQDLLNNGICIEHKEAIVETMRKEIETMKVKNEAITMKYSNVEQVSRDTKLQTQSIVESSKNEITNLTQKASYLQEKLNAKDEIIDSLRNQYEIQKQQLDQAIQDANENKEHASREVANVRKSEETIQKLMEALQKIRQRIQIIERNEGIEVSDIHDRSSITLEGVEEKLKLLKQENIDESEKKKSLQNIIEKQNRHIALLRTELKKANTHLTKTESELSGLNHKHAKYDVKLSDLEFTMKQLDELKLVLSLSTDCEIDEVHEKLHEILKLSSETNSKSLELLDAEKVIKDSAANQTELCEKLSNLQGVLLQKDFQIKDYEVIIANQKDRCIQLEQDLLNNGNCIEHKEAIVETMRKEIETMKVKNEAITMKYSNVEQVLKEKNQYLSTCQNIEKTVFEQKNTIALLQNRICSFESSLNSSKKTVLHLEGLLGKREFEVTSLKSSLGESEKINNDIMLEAKNLNEKVEVMKKYEAEYPVMHLLIKDYEELISTLRKEGELLRQRSKTLINEIKAESEQNQIVQIRENNMLREKVKNLLSERQAAQVESENLVESIESSKRKLDEMLDLKEMINSKINECSNLQTKNQELQVLVENQCGIMEEDKKEITILRAKMANTIVEISKLDKEKAEKDEHIQARKDKLNALESELNSLKSHLTTLEENFKLAGDVAQEQEKKLEISSEKYELTKTKNIEMKRILMQLEKDLEEAEQLAKSVPNLENKLVETEECLKSLMKVYIELQQELVKIKNEKSVVDSDLEERCDSEQTRNQKEQSMRFELEQTKEGKNRRKLDYAKAEMLNQRSTITRIREKAKYEMKRKVELEESQQNVDVLKYVKSRMSKDFDVKSRNSSNSTLISRSVSSPLTYISLEPSQNTPFTPVPSITVRKYAE